MMYAEAAPVAKNTLGNNLAGLSDAVELADAQFNRLRDLADRLNGPIPRATESAAPTTKPGLVESYCTETRRIREILTNIAQVITEIQTAI